jgi:hypothetical protein
MSLEESIASKILTDINIIADIYNIIQDAGFKAVNSDLVKATKNNVNIIKPNIKGINRKTVDCRGARYDKNKNNKSCIKTNKYSIEYDANDIMIVGGSALNIYDYLLKEFKGKRGIAAMEEYIKKKTSDIDIVWWPRPPIRVDNNTIVTDEIIVSTSDAIINLVKVFKEELENEFKKEDIKTKIKTQIEPYVYNTINLNDSNLEIVVNYFQTIPAGVHNININFHINNHIVKISDISIHDNGSSQLFDNNGNIINDLRSMYVDPVYCYPIQGYDNTISKFKINNIKVGLPNIYSFIKQQLLAFDNLMRTEQIKSIINYKRVEYIKLLLQKWKPDNIGEKNILGTDIPKLLFDISNIQNKSITLSRDKIINICISKDISRNDSIVTELCKNAINPYIVNNIQEMQQIYNRLEMEHKDIKYKNMNKIKMKLYELKTKMQNFISNYYKISPYNFIETGQYKKLVKNIDEVKNILEEEKKIMSQLRIPLSSRIIESIPQYSTHITEPYPIAFRSVIFNTTNKGIDIYITDSGIKWYINPDNGYIIRFNPLSQQWEKPLARNPLEGIPPISITHDGIRYLVNKLGYIIRFNPFTHIWEQVPYGYPPQYGLPVPSGVFVPQRQFHTSLIKSNRHTKNKKRQYNNITLKK